jgi:hypothetical protein
MDKNKFWLGGRPFNTASPRLACINATQGTSARWAPKRNTRHVRKLGTPTQRKARPQVGCPNARPQRKARPQVGCPNARPQRKARPHVRKLGSPTQHKARPECKARHVHNARHVRNARQGTSTTQGTSASWAAQRTSATQTQGTSAIWAPQRNARHVRKMVAQTQNSSATKTSTQGSTRLKDELEDG